MAETNDIFGYKRNAKPSGVFSSEDSSLFVSGGNGSGGSDVASKGYLIQNWNISYSQNVEELFEVGSNRLYWMKGRPQGQGGIGRVLGAQKDGKTAGLFSNDAFDLCTGGATMVINATGGHCTTTGAGASVLNKGVDITMSGVVVVSLGFSMAVPDVRIVENFGWRFAKLELK